jgi:hypothetical protein
MTHQLEVDVLTDFDFRLGPLSFEVHFSSEVCLPVTNKNPYYIWYKISYVRI